MANNALNCFHMPEAPLLEPVFYIHKILSQLVEVKKLICVSIYTEPNVPQFCVELMGRVEIPGQQAFRHVKSTPGQQGNCFVIYARIVQSRFKRCMDLCVVAVGEPILPRVDTFES